MQRIVAPARILIRHRGLMGLLGCSLLMGLASSFIAPFLSMFGTIEVGMSPFVFGGFMTITSLSAIALSTLLARWSDTGASRRTMLLIGSASGLLGYAGYAFVRDVVWLTVIGSLVLGLSSVTFSQVFAYAREMLARSDIPPRDAPLFINIYRLVFSLAWTAGPAIAAWVMLRYSYRGTFLGAAFFFLLLLAVILALVPDAPALARNTPEARAPLREIFARPGLLAYFAGFVLLFTCTSINMMNLPLLVLQTLGGTVRHVGIVFSVAPVFELPFMFYFGLLASQGDQGRLIRAAAVAAVVYFALLALVGAPGHIYPIQILSAAITAVIAGVAITFFQNFLPEQVGTATNLYANAMRIGSTTGYLLFGVLASTLSHRLILVACALLSAAAAAIMFWSRFRPAPAAVGVVEPARVAAVMAETAGT